MEGVGGEGSTGRNRKEWVERIAREDRPGRNRKEQVQRLAQGGIGRKGSTGRNRKVWAEKKVEKGTEESGWRGKCRGNKNERVGR
jgi:hypothetical protein